MTETRDDRHGLHGHNWGPMLSLKDIQFLSLQDSSLAVKRHQDDSPQVTARIPKSFVPRVLIPSLSTFKEDDRKSNEENRPNIRASSVPRPRAVLSSPENDAITGSKNKNVAVRSPGSMKQKLTKSKHAQCKVVNTNASDKSLIDAKQSKASIDKGRKKSETAFSKLQKAPVRESTEAKI